MESRAYLHTEFLHYTLYSVVQGFQLRNFSSLWSGLALPGMVIPDTWSSEFNEFSGPELALYSLKDNYIKRVYQIITMYTPVAHYSPSDGVCHVKCISDDIKPVMKLHPSLSDFAYDLIIKINNYKDYPFC